MVSLPLCSNCWREMTVTGAGVVRSLRRMREPVTTISSWTSLRSSGAAVGAGAGAAAAGAGWASGAAGGGGLLVGGRVGAGGKGRRKRIKRLGGKRCHGDDAD